VTKDYPSALEYMKQAWEFAELFDLTACVISRGEEFLNVPRLDRGGRPGSFTEEIKVGVIKFDTGSRIIAFSSNPQAMAVYGGDVGLDEFAKHPNARLLWETAQGRAALAHDVAVWSAHDGEDTLFYQFAQQARAAFEVGSCRLKVEGCAAEKRGLGIGDCELGDQEDGVQSPMSNGQSQGSGIRCPWNLYFRVTMPDAIEMGFLEVINRARGTRLKAEQFLADCRARAGLEEIYEQSYLCNPVPPAAAIVEWSAIERCRFDYEIERLHLEHDEIVGQFGEPQGSGLEEREGQIERFVRRSFPGLFGPQGSTRQPQLRLGFDVAASGRGNLAAIYLDEARGKDLWLKALFTCRTDDWHFLKTVVFALLQHLPRARGAGDESGLGRQICWEAEKQFGSNKFTPVDFSSRKSDLGFLLMNQLASGQKRVPRGHQDIAADFFALRKEFSGTRWMFSEGRNPYNAASHCDIAWAGALASEANARKRSNAWAMVG
jgi:phage FluMu gp28-like protein